MKDIKVATIGEILFDVFEDDKKPGGSSLNVALHLHKQGIATHFISAVGHDENGKELLDYLEKQNFPTNYIQKADMPTSTVTVKLDEQKQATYTIEEPVAWDAIQLNPDLIELVKTVDAFVYCSLTCRNEKSRNTIFQLLNHAKLKIFDINLRAPFYDITTLKHLISQADILKINEDELAYLSKELSITNDEEVILNQLKTQFDLKLICLTKGDRGANVLYRDKIYTHPGYAAKIKDTVGAGDSFLATFINYYLQKEEIEKVLDKACKVGAFVASQAGANPNYPKNLLQ